jgi:hypothetical protein
LAGKKQPATKQITVKAILTMKTTAFVSIFIVATNVYVTTRSYYYSHR